MFERFWENRVKSVLDRKSALKPDAYANKKASHISLLENAKSYQKLFIKAFYNINLFKVDTTDFEDLSTEVTFDKVTYPCSIFFYLTLPVMWN